MSGLTILPRSQFYVKVVLASCLFVTMTAFETSPLLLRLSTHIPSHPGDPLLVAWLLAWDFHALTTHPWDRSTQISFTPQQIPWPYPSI